METIELIQELSTCPSSIEIGYFERNNVWYVRVYAQGAEIYIENHGKGYQLYIGKFEAHTLRDALIAAQAKVQHEQRKKPFRPQLVPSGD